MPIFTNCGRYLPGQEPINPQVRIRKTPVSIIPTVGGGTTPVIIIAGQDDKWKCTDIVDIPCPPPWDMYPAAFIRRCRECDGNFNPNYGNNNPPTSDPDCNYVDEAQCLENCSDQNFICPLPTKFKCEEIEQIYCPFPNAAQVYTVVRQCRPCDGLTRPDGAINPSPNDPGCIYDNKEDCRSDCQDIFYECETIFEQLYECKENQIPCSQKFGPRWIGTYLERSCQPCIPISYNPNGTPIWDPECETFLQCFSDPYCQDNSTGCDEIIGPGGIDPNAVVPPGSVIFSEDATNKYICKSIRDVPCTSPLIGIERREYDCVECRKEIRTFEGSSFVVYLDPNLPIEPDPPCQVLSACEPPCIDELIGCIEPNNTGYGSVITGHLEGKSTNIGLGTVALDRPTGQVNNSILKYGSIARGNSVLNVIINDDNSLSINTSLALQETLKLIENKEVKKIKISNYDKNISKVTLEEQTSQIVLYNKKLNFFSPNEKDLYQKKSRLVQNNFYREIFAEYVCDEIDHVLKTTNTNLPWDETKVLSITLDKIGVSLNPYVLNILNNINDLSFQKIPLNTFLEVIKKHLLTGTLDEFDINYYKELYERQKNNEVKEYIKFESKTLLEKTALKVINENQITLSLENKLDYNVRQLRRSKNLNEDVNVRTKIETLEGEVFDVYIPNKGLDITYLDVDESFVNIEELVSPLENGPGDGYYVPLQTYEGDVIAFEYETDVSAAAQTPPEVRYDALKLIGEDPNFYITASSLSGSHEFVSGDTGQVSFEPMYFKLVLSSVTSDVTDNLLVDRYNAKYVRVASQSAIDEHCDTNGLSVTMVSIDYKDPIYRYIKDRSSFEYYQNDINFKRQTLNKGIGNNTILTRNIPFGLVILPVRGSRYNPFNGMSNIERHSNNIVVRTLSLTPSINDSLPDLNSNNLEEKFLYETNNSFKVGVLEPVDPQALTYRFNASSLKMANTFFNTTDKSYTNSSIVSSASSNGLSYLIKDVLDPLIDKYEPTQLIWYDVLRRMPINKFGELIYNSNNDILISLGEGLRGGVLIKNVLNRTEDDTDETLPDDNMVVIKLEDR